MTCACSALPASSKGRVEVEIGKEGLKFENGAFTYYGVSALTAPSSGKPAPQHLLPGVPQHVPILLSAPGQYPAGLPGHQFSLSLAAQSPVSSRQPTCHDLSAEPADGACSSTYCPDYTVRALSDLQLVKVTVGLPPGFRQAMWTECKPRATSWVARARPALLHPSRYAQGYGPPRAGQLSSCLLGDSMLSPRSHGCSTSMHSWLPEPRACLHPQRMPASRWFRVATPGCLERRRLRQQVSPVLRDPEDGALSSSCRLHTACCALALHLPLFSSSSGSHLAGGTSLNQWPLKQSL